MLSKSCQGYSFDFMFLRTCSRDCSIRNSEPPVNRRTRLHPLRRKGMSVHLLETRLNFFILREQEKFQRLPEWRATRQSRWRERPLFSS